MFALATTAIVFVVGRVVCCCGLCVVVAAVVHPFQCLCVLHPFQCSSFPFFFAIVFNSQWQIASLR